MEKPSITYILLQDGRFGKKLWSVDFRATPEQLSKGALLEELRKPNNPETQPGLLLSYLSIHKSVLSVVGRMLRLLQEKKLTCFWPLPRIH